MIEKLPRFTYNNNTFSIVQGIRNPIVLEENLTFQDITNPSLFDQNSYQVLFIKGIFSSAMADRLELNERLNKGKV